MSLNLDSTTPQLSSTESEAQPNLTGNTVNGNVNFNNNFQSTFGNDILEYHPYLQNLWKQQVTIYHPYVAQCAVRPLDDHTQRVCNHRSMNQFQFP